MDPSACTGCSQAQAMGRSTPGRISISADRCTLPTYPTGSRKEPSRRPPPCGYPGSSEPRSLNFPSGLATCSHNTPGTPARFSATARAGGSITAHWNPWPHDGGPLSVWMVECGGDCSSFRSPHTAKWFKIHEEGLSGTQKLKRASNSLSVTIPASLKPGNYLIRHELINLAKPPAEFYPECAQLKVTGSGSKSPGPQSRSTLSNAYRMSLPELSQSWNSWKPKANSYKFPGPPVWRG